MGSDDDGGKQNGNERGEGKVINRTTTRAGWSSHNRNLPFEQWEMLELPTAPGTYLVKAENDVLTTCHGRS